MQQDESNVRTSVAAVDGVSPLELSVIHRVGSLDDCSVNNDKLLSLTLRATRSSLEEGAVGHHHHRKASSILTTSHWIFKSDYDKTCSKLVNLQRRFSFLQINAAFFIAVSVFGAFALIAAEMKNLDLNFIDAWFMSLSSLACAGLEVVDMGSMTNASQVFISILTFIGSPIIISVFPLLVRIASLREQIIQKTAQENDGAGRGDMRALIEVNCLRLRALIRLVWIVVVYFLACHLIGFFILVIYISFNSETRGIIQRYNGGSVAGFSIFHVVSGFNNTGFSTISQELIPLRYDFFLLFVLWILLLLGNTYFPVALRIIIKSLQRRARSGFAKQEYDFLLMNSRSSFPYLYPQFNTTLVHISIHAAIFIQVVWFLGLDWNKGAVFADLNAFQKIYCAIFQSAAVRYAGFEVFDVSSKSAAVRAIEILLMYIAVVPVSLVEKISPKKNDVEQLGNSQDSLNKPVYVRAYKFLLEKQFYMNHGILLILLTILIATFEDNMLRNDPGMTFFKIVFETVSAFGSVGLSLGYPGSYASLSGQFQGVSKFIMICILFQARQRDLPDFSIDFMTRISIPKKGELSDDQGDDDTAIIDDLQLDDLGLGNEDHDNRFS